MQKICIKDLILLPLVQGRRTGEETKQFIEHHTLNKFLFSRKYTFNFGFGVIGWGWGWGWLIIHHLLLIRHFPYPLVLLLIDKDRRKKLCNWGKLCDFWKNELNSWVWVMIYLIFKVVILGGIYRGNIGEKMKEKKNWIWENLKSLEDKELIE